MPRALYPPPIGHKLACLPVREGTPGPMELRHCKVGLNPDCDSLGFGLPPGSLPLHHALLGLPPCFPFQLWNVGVPWVSVLGPPVLSFCREALCAVVLFGVPSMMTAAAALSQSCWQVLPILPGVPPTQPLPSEHPCSSDPFDEGLPCAHGSSSTILHHSSP